jgi:phosphoribosylformylglycinamidine synthase
MVQGRRRCDSSFWEIWLTPTTRGWGFGGSAYLQVIHGLKTGAPPRCDLEAESDLQLGLRALIHSGVVKSARTIAAKAGWPWLWPRAASASKSARDTPKARRPADIHPRAARAGRRTQRRGSQRLAGAWTPCSSARPRAASLSPPSSQDAVKVIERARLLGIKAARIGTVGGDELRIRTAAGEWAMVRGGVVRDLWWNSIARAMRE